MVNLCQGLSLSVEIMRERRQAMMKSLFLGAAVLTLSGGAALAQTVYVAPAYAVPAYTVTPPYVAPAPAYIVPPATVGPYYDYAPPAAVTAAPPLYDYAPTYPGAVTVEDDWD
jgi:hypothetical protein